MSLAVALEQSTVLVAQEPTGATGSPGILGFVVTFAVAVVVVGLVLAMTGSLRRVKHRAQLEEEAAGSPERRAVPRDAGDVAADQAGVPGGSSEGPVDAAHEGEDPGARDRA